MIWRVGRKLGRTLYRDEVLVGMVDTPELAAQIVAAMNAQRGEYTYVSAGYANDPRHSDHLFDDGDGCPTCDRDVHQDP